MANQTIHSVRAFGHAFQLEAVPCDFCGSSAFVPFWSKMRHGINLPTVFCQECGLCQTNPRPDVDAQNEFYRHFYHRFHKRRYFRDIETGYLAKSKRDGSSRVNLLSKFISSTGNAAVFEVGSGAGQFIVAARATTQWSLSGIEPNQESWRLCDKQQLPVRNCALEEESLGRGSFDAVVSFHVLEHVRSPSMFLQKVNGLLRPGGILYLEVPNLSWFSSSGLTDFFQFPHLYSFNQITLRNYLTSKAKFAVRLWVEQHTRLSVVATKTDDGATFMPEGYERFDVSSYAYRLKMLDRVRRLGRLVPNLSLLKRIRKTLVAC
jgi:2-polyprenyl-3-methyl-5-hydroxy-6-metoxy-1,4-benzoquinol methylase